MCIVEYMMSDLDSILVLAALLVGLRRCKFSIQEEILSIKYKYVK